MNINQLKLTFSPWIDPVISEFTKSFSQDYGTDILAFLHENIDKEIENASTGQARRKRTLTLYSALTYLYNHFCIKISDQQECSNVKISSVKLLSQLIRTGIILNGGKQTSEWLDRVLTILKLYQGDSALIYDALLLVNYLKKKYRKAYIVLLQHILKDNEDKESITDPLVFMKVVLLYRRLKSLLPNKYKRASVITMASKLKPPSNLISWLLLFEIEGVTDLKHKTIVKQLMGKKFPDILFQTVRELSLSHYNFENSSGMKFQAVAVKEEDLFIVDRSSMNNPLHYNQAVTKVEEIQNSIQADALSSKKGTRTQEESPTSKKKKKQLLLKQEKKHDSGKIKKSAKQVSDICVSYTNDHGDLITEYVDEDDSGEYVIGDSNFSESSVDSVSPRTKESLLPKNMEESNVGQSDLSVGMSLSSSIGLNKKKRKLGSKNYELDKDGKKCSLNQPDLSGSKPTFSNAKKSKILSVETENFVSYKDDSSNDACFTQTVCLNTKKSKLLSKNDEKSLKNRPNSFIESQSSTAAISQDKSKFLHGGKTGVSVPHVISFNTKSLPQSHDIVPSQKKMKLSKHNEESANEADSLVDVSTVSSDSNFPRLFKNSDKSKDNVIITSDSSDSSGDTSSPQVIKPNMTPSKLSSKASSRTPSTKKIKCPSKNNEKSVSQTSTFVNSPICLSTAKSKLSKDGKSIVEQFKDDEAITTDQAVVSESSSFAQIAILNTKPVSIAPSPRILKQKGKDSKKSEKQDEIFSSQSSTPTKYKLFPNDSEKCIEKSTANEAIIADQSDSPVTLRKDSKKSNIKQSKDDGNIISDQSDFSIDLCTIQTNSSSAKIATVSPVSLTKSKTGFSCNDYIELGDEPDCVEFVNLVDSDSSNNEKNLQKCNKNVECFESASNNISSPSKNIHLNTNDMQNISVNSTISTGEFSVSNHKTSLEKMDKDFFINLCYDNGANFPENVNGILKIDKLSKSEILKAEDIFNSSSKKEVTKITLKEGPYPQYVDDENNSNLQSLLQKQNEQVTNTSEALSNDISVCPESYTINSENDPSATVHTSLAPDIEKITVTKGDINCDTIPQNSHLTCKNNDADVNNILLSQKCGTFDQTHDFNSCALGSNCENEISNGKSDQIVSPSKNSISESKAPLISPMCDTPIKCSRDLGIKSSVVSKDTPQNTISEFEISKNMPILQTVKVNVKRLNISSSAKEAMAKNLSPGEKINNNNLEYSPNLFNDNSQINCLDVQDDIKRTASKKQDIPSDSSNLGYHLCNTPKKSSVKPTSENSAAANGDECRNSSSSSFEMHKVEELDVCSSSPDSGNISKSTSIDSNEFEESSSKIDNNNDVDINNFAQSSSPKLGNKTPVKSSNLVNVPDLSAKISASKDMEISSNDSIIKSPSKKESPKFGIKRSLCTNSDDSNVNNKRKFLSESNETAVEMDSISKGAIRTIVEPEIKKNVVSQTELQHVKVDSENDTLQLTKTTTEFNSGCFSVSSENMPKVVNISCQETGANFSFSSLKENKTVEIQKIDSDKFLNLQSSSECGKSPTKFCDVNDSKSRNLDEIYNKLPVCHSQFAICNNSSEKCIEGNFLISVEEEKSVEKVDVKNNKSDELLENVIDVSKTICSAISEKVNVPEPPIQKINEEKSSRKSLRLQNKLENKTELNSTNKTPVKNSDVAALTVDITRSEDTDLSSDDTGIKFSVKKELPTLGIKRSLCKETADCNEDNKHKLLLEFNEATAENDNTAKKTQTIIPPVIASESNTEKDTLKSPINITEFNSELVPFSCENKTYLTFSNISCKNKYKEINRDTTLIDSNPITNFSHAASAEIFSSYRNNYQTEENETDQIQETDDLNFSSHSSPEAEKSLNHSFEVSDSESDSKYSNSNEVNNKLAVYQSEPTISNISSEICIKSDFPIVVIEKKCDEKTNLHVQSSNGVFVENDDKDVSNTSCSEEANIPEPRVRNEEKSSRKSLRLKNKIENKKELNSEAISKSVCSSEDTSQKEWSFPEMEIIDFNSNSDSISKKSSSDISSSESEVMQCDNKINKTTSELKSRTKDKSKEKNYKLSTPPTYSLRKSKRKKDLSSALGIDISQLNINSPNKISTRSSTKCETESGKVPESPKNCTLQNQEELLLSSKRSTRSSVIIRDVKEGDTVDKPSYNLRTRKAIIEPAKLNIEKNKSI